LCTDNGAMIAWAGAERLSLGLTDGLDVKPHARWPLSEVRQARPEQADAEILRP
jgi:N6-L-threonylcarbamoyladenine synthase